MNNYRYAQITDTQALTSVKSFHIFLYETCETVSKMNGNKLTKLLTELRATISGRLYSWNLGISLRSIIVRFFFFFFVILTRIRTHITS
jgi:hypothetical protein